MKRSDQYSLSALRSIDHAADVDFMNQLSDRVLLEAWRFSDASLESGKVDNFISLAELKSALSLNYKVLTQALRILTANRYVKVVIKPNTPQDTFEPGDILIKVTEEGTRKTRNVLYSRKAF